MTTRFKWKYTVDPDKWDAQRWFYFPFAEQFLRHCPWLAVRVFWVIIKIKEKLNA